jgi:hypothetical protein
MKPRPPEVERLKNDYLDRVKAALTGREESEIEEILESLREHIDFELTENREEPIGLVQMANVLEKLGPPESYIHNDVSEALDTIGIVRAQAKECGRIVSWNRLKKGQLVDKERLCLTPTTALTDVVTDMIKECKRLDPASKVSPIFPNGFTTASFDIQIHGSAFNITCGRRLVRGFFPLNPIAAEIGRNYDVIVTVWARSSRIRDRLLDVVRQKYCFETIS